MAIEKIRMVGGSEIEVYLHDEPQSRVGEDVYYSVNVVVDEHTCDNCRQWIEKYVKLTDWIDVHNDNASGGHGGCDNPNGCRCTLGDRYYPNKSFGSEL